MKLTDELVQQLTNNTISLTSLEIDGNQIRFSDKDKSIKQVISIIEKNHTLTDFKVGVALFGTSPVEIASALQRNSTLTSIDFRGCYLKEEGVGALASVLGQHRSITSLSFRGNELGDGGISKLASALRVNTVLKKLDLSSTKINSGGAISLARMLENNQFLTMLNIGLNAISDGGVMALALSLKFNNTLQNLNLQSNKLNSAQMEKLASALENNNTLRSLNLSYIRDGLDNKSISDTQITPLSLALTKNSSLRTLDLSGNALNSKDAKLIGSMLEVNQGIQVLELNSNKLEDDGIKYLAGSLKANTILTSINLSYNSIRDSGLEDIASVLACNSTLVSLALEGNLYGPVGIWKLIEILAGNHSLRGLNIRARSSFEPTEDQVAENYARLFTQLLLRNHTLQSLNLVCYEIGNYGATLLAAGLRQNQSIQIINLSFNDIGDQGFEALAAALIFNQTLKELIIEQGNEGEKISVAGAKKIAETFKKNASLSKLDLTRNRLGDEGLIELASGLKDNCALASLNLKENGIHLEAVEKFAKILEHNYILTEVIVEVASPTLNVLLQRNKKLSEFQVNKLVKAMNVFSEKIEAMTLSNEKILLEKIQENDNNTEALFNEALDCLEIDADAILNSLADFPEVQNRLRQQWVQMQSLCIRSLLNFGNLSCALEKAKQVTSLEPEAALQLALNIFPFDQSSNLSRERNLLKLYLLKWAYPLQDAERLTTDVIFQLIHNATEKSLSAQLTELIGVEKIVPINGLQLDILKAIENASNDLSPEEKLMLEHLKKIRYDQLNADDLYLICQHGIIKSFLRKTYHTSSVTTYELVITDLGQFPVKVKTETSVRLIDEKIDQLKSSTLKPFKYVFNHVLAFNKIIEFLNSENHIEKVDTRPSSSSRDNSVVLPGRHAFLSGHLTKAKDDSDVTRSDPGNAFKI